VVPLRLVAAALVQTFLIVQSSFAQVPADRPRIAAGTVPEMPAMTWEAEPMAVAVDTVATNLEIVAELAFAPDGRLFVAERPGRVRVVSSDGELVDGEWLTLVERIYL